VQGNSWFFILPDYAMGKSMAAVSMLVIEPSGGEVVGCVVHPFPGNEDHSR